MKRLDLSVGQKLTIGSLVVAILIAALGAVLVTSVSRVSDLRRQKFEVIAPRVEIAQALERALYRQAVALRNYGISRSAADLEIFRRSVQEVAASLDRVRTLPKSNDSTALVSAITPVIDEHRRSFDRLLSLLATNADITALRQQEVVISAHRDRALAITGEFARLQTEQIDAADRAIDGALDDLRRTVTLVTVLILAASVVTAFLVSHSVSRPANGLVAAADALRAGDFAPALSLRAGPDDRPAGERERPFHDELREASHVFGRMAETLQLREGRLAAHARLSAVLSTSLDTREVASCALREIAAHLGAEVGAVYLSDGELLHPVASIATAAEPATLRLGEGLPGQAAADRRTLSIRDIPPDTPFNLRLGIDTVPPRTVLAAPMVVKDSVIGVIVLGALHDLDQEAVRFVEQSAGQVGVTLDNAAAHERIALLAAELQEKNEALQAQNEELQAQGEELQAQTEELQSQAEELQAQTDELRAQSEELREQQAAVFGINAALREAEQQKNRFLAVLGHELRNPLAAIRSAESLLDDVASDEEHRNLHQIIRRQTTHLVRLVDDLLDIGRITSGKIVLNRRRLDLAGTVEHCVRTISGNGASQGPRIRTEVADRVWIDGDETRIEQIVTNLLTNAVRHTPPEGTIVVHVGRDGEGAFVRVTDDGSGIEPELLPRIFDLFVQGELRAEKPNGGLGVGLSLVRTLVELHGGSVAAASEGRGRGTTITVRLPAAEAPSEPAAKASPVVTALPSRRSIVLVEDNPDLRQMMKLLLDRSGHSVTEAIDGPGAVDAVTKVRPDVALVDLDLPGFDGCEVARRIRLDTAMAGVRLIAVSGYGRAEDRERALLAGFDDHLVKPIDLGRLAAVLES